MVLFSEVEADLQSISLCNSYPRVTKRVHPKCGVWWPLIKLNLRLSEFCLKQWLLWLARKHGAMVEGEWEDPLEGWPPGSLQALGAWTEMVKQRLLAFPGKLAQPCLLLWHGHHVMAAVLVHRVKASRPSPDSYLRGIVDSGLGAHRWGLALPLTL